jgi:hypothetical protein
MGDNGGEAPGQEELTDAERERLDTLKRVLRVHIDGEWDEQMMDAAFDRLERLLSRQASEEVPAESGEGDAKASRRPSSSGRRRGRRT